MRRPTAHRRDERGALSSNAALVAALVILAAVAYYAVSGGPGGSSAAPGQPTPSATTSAALPTPSSSDSVATASPSTESASPTVTTSPTPTIKRSSYRVGVYNNSTVNGLAGRTATRVTKLGWHVIAVTNWSGSIPSSTVYYPPGSRRAAKLLAADLGLTRVRAATSAMSQNSLSLILTGPLP